MSFRFVFGASGAGKSSMLYEDVIRRSLKTPDHSVHYVFVVPDQYTMQVQKDLVLAHPNRGIMDIEVLSFNRLTHRIFEETGAGGQTLLDDTGKNLIVRRIAAAHEKELSVLAGRMHTPGMISEVKSVLSEFLQYGIDPEDVARMKERARESERRRLFLRLQDLEILYRAFLKYERDRFITSEETLDLLAEAIPSSEFIRRSVLVFDGFTGFTPVQYRVLGELLRCAMQVTFSFQYADDGFMPMPQVIESGNPGSEAALFYMTRRSVCDLVKLAAERDVPHVEDIYISGETPKRFADSPAMAHLEKHLFRDEKRPYEGGDKVPEILESSTPEEEVRQMFIRLRKEIAAGGGAFRDYAVICSDTGTYVPILNRLSLRYEVPLYIDETSGAMHNVLTEHIRSALRIRLSGFSYESVFHYLRAGLSSLTREETDLLENECLRRGVRSRKKWELPFSAETELLRVRFLSEIAPLLAPVRTAAERSEALYSFLRGGGVGKRLEEMSKELREAQDEERAIAYGQIYEKVLCLLRQICELIGGEKISGEEYLLLLEAGFAELRLGTLPQNADSVLVGDMERTRLPEIRTLFFLGVNDDFVPRRSSGGGLISEMERAFLKESGYELAPMPEEQIYRQRFYLYMNLTKPRDRVILSCARISQDGKALRPSYIISLLKELFPAAEVTCPETADLTQQITGLKDGFLLLARRLRQYTDGELSAQPEKETELFSVFAQMSAADEEGRAAAKTILDAAFARYRPKRLTEKTAAALYGERITAGVTRLETMAACSLRQFLQYGLRLGQRREYVFERTDAGTVLHASLEYFDALLKRAGSDWLSFSGEEGSKLAAKALEHVAEGYGDLVMYATARSGYAAERMKRILKRSVDTLQFQLRQGDFVPAGAEIAFGLGGAPAIRYPLSGGRELLLVGKIDRLDVCESDQNRYLKIVDYKSGTRDLDPAQIRRGLQLQLPVYMEALRRIEQDEDPEKNIIPAAMLYYRMDDPLAKKGEDAETVRALLRPRGLVNGDPDVIAHLDRDFAGASQVIPVSRKKDGTLSAASDVFSSEEFEMLSADVDSKIRELSENILGGEIAAAPRLLKKGVTSCSYCPFAGACGFDTKIRGYEVRTD